MLSTYVFHLPIYSAQKVAFMVISVLVKNLFVAVVVFFHKNVLEKGNQPQILEDIEG